MYSAYFGLREKPFKLVPNPEYLFLSKSHEIAMAHLTYATEQGEGFVVLTGEVGTGKTTLCRNYLERLDEKTESAYIFNPNLEHEQLLAAICQEFGIGGLKKGAKAILEQLYTFLIRKNSADKKVVLVIDEAQSLSYENLELVRMLSNLETTRSKLLQIVLVGQPELENKLESYELRQLAQRISLSYHLAPLSSKDTQAYIRHRLAVASQQGQSELFSVDACRLAYRFSKGIPRLINIVCDRALLTAYSHNQEKVTKRVMQTAIMELVSRGKPTSRLKRWPVLLGAAVCLLALVFAAAVIIMRGGFKAGSGLRAPESNGGEIEASAAEDAKRFKIPETDNSVNKITDPLGQAVPAQDQAALPAFMPAIPEASVRQQSGHLPDTASEPSSASVFKPSVEPTPPRPDTQVAGPDRPINPQPGPGSPVFETIQRLDPESSRQTAASILLSIWRQPRPDVGMIPADVDDPSFFEIAARQYGLRNLSVQDNWDLVRRLDLPAIVALKREPMGDRVYLTLTGWHDQTLRFRDSRDGAEVQWNFESVRPYLEGPVHVFWKNATGYDMIINYGADSKAILAVKILLRQIGYDQVTLAPQFDQTTRSAVIDFQSRHNITVDGLVGSLTKIMLLREAGTIAMPTLAGSYRPRS